VLRPGPGTIGQYSPSVRAISLSRSERPDMKRGQAGKSAGPACLTAHFELPPLYRLD
jgi:hypothetical protein